MSDSRPTSTRRRALKLAGVTGFSGVAGLTGLSLSSQPVLAISGSVGLPSGLIEGAVDVSSYELQYAELDTTSDITITYVLRTQSETVNESHTVPITEPTGSVMTGSHSINVPSGEVTLQVQLEHPSVGTVTTEESPQVTIESAMPESVVVQFDGDTFTTGDSTWTDESGSEDVSITGSPESVTLNDGSKGVKSDGSNDHGLYPFPISGTGLQRFAIEFTYESTSTTGSSLTGVVQSDNQEVQIWHNVDYDFNSDDGNLFLKLRDLDGNQVQFGPDSANINDGAVHNIIMNVYDSTTNDVEVQIDGTVQTLNFSSQQSPDNFGSWVQNMAVWARNLEGSIDSRSNVGFGTIRIHDDPVSGPTIE